MASWMVLPEAGGKVDEVRDDLAGSEVPTWPIDAPKVEHLAAEAHIGSGERIDGDLECQHNGLIRVGADQRRRAAGSAQRFGSLLGHEIG